MSAQRPIYIQVVHGEPIINAGIVALLSASEEILISTAGLAHARALMASDLQEQCDVVIADYPGASALASLARRHRGKVTNLPRIVAVTALDGEWDIHLAMQAGVQGYVLQRCGRDQLVEAVRAVVKGSNYLSIELTSKLAESLTRDRLTSRQMEVLGAMCTGASNRDISERLGISDTTVKTHISAILSKFGVCARTEAVAIALERGIVRRALAQAEYARL